MAGIPGCVIHRTLPYNQREGSHKAGALPATVVFERNWNIFSDFYKLLDDHRISMSCTNGEINLVGNNRMNIRMTFDFAFKSYFLFYS
jgi:hypothetical protein